MHLLWITFLVLASTHSPIKRFASASGSSSSSSSSDSSANNFKFVITEELPVGSLIGDMKKEARFASRYSAKDLVTLEFRILSPPALPFVVEQKSGRIVTDGSIDRDSLMQCKDKELCQIQIDVTVKPMQFFEILKISIDILDVNDNAPYFKESSAILSVRESIAVGSSVQLPIAFDLDSPQFAVRSYELSDCKSPHFGLKVFERKDSVLEPRLVILSNLDRELEDKFSMKLLAIDGGNPSLTATIDVEVQVTDANDNCPKFERPVYDVNVTEDVEPGTNLIKVHATDDDLGLNGQVVYRFSDQTLASFGSLFMLDRRTGMIKTLRRLDRELMSTYQLSIFAEDLGPDSVPVDTRVVVKVQDVNDNHPSITISTLSSRQTESTEVWENQAPHTFVAHVTVIDPDEGRNGSVECNISSDHFVLLERYPTEYQILTSRILDHEQRSKYAVTLTCSDLGQPRLSSQKTITIHINNINDNIPKFERDSYHVKLHENNMKHERLLQLKATDDDGDVDLKFSSSASDVIEIDQFGNVMVMKIMDREEIEKCEIQLFVIDSGSPQLTGSAILTIEVLDVNDESPTFVLQVSSFNLSQWLGTGSDRTNNQIFEKERDFYFFEVAENEPTGTFVGRIIATDRDKTHPNNQIKYSFLKKSATNSTRIVPAVHYTQISSTSSFTIFSDTGIIVTSSSLDRESKSLQRFVVVATDMGTPSFSSSVDVVVKVADRNDNHPLFDPPLKSTYFFPPLQNIEGRSAASQAVNDTHHSIYLSSAVSSRHFVARVAASDADEGINSRVSYAIESGNDDAMFSIEESSGEIATTTSMLSITHREFNLLLVAQDAGSPYMLTKSFLKIIVNDTIAPPANQSSIRLRNLTWLLVVIILLACLFVVALSIALLVLHRRKTKKLKRHRIEHREKALKILTSKEIVEFQQAFEAADRHNSLPSILKKKQHIVDSVSSECSERLLTASFNSTNYEHKKPNSLPKLDKNCQPKMLTFQQDDLSKEFYFYADSKALQVKWSSCDNSPAASSEISKTGSLPVEPCRYEWPNVTSDLLHSTSECLCNSQPNSTRTSTPGTSHNRPFSFFKHNQTTSSSKARVNFSGNFERVKGTKVVPGLTRITEHPV